MAMAQETQGDDDDNDDDDEEEEDDDDDDAALNIWNEVLKSSLWGPKPGRFLEAERNLISSQSNSRIGHFGYEHDQVSTMRMRQVWHMPLLGGVTTSDCIQKNNFCWPRLLVEIASAPLPWWGIWYANATIVTCFLILFGGACFIQIEIHFGQTLEQYGYMDIWIYGYMDIWIYDIYIYIHMYVCIYIYMYVYVYVYV